MSEIKKTFKEISVDNVKPHAFKGDSIDVAQLRQTVTTTYPSMRLTNSESDLLFDTSEYGIEDGQSFESVRVCWANVPKGTTSKQIAAKLAASPDSKIYRKISNNCLDVLSEEQINAIATGFVTGDHYPERMKIRDKDGNDLAGAAQYSQNFLSLTGKEDEDKRSTPVEEATLASSNEVGALTP